MSEEKPVMIRIRWVRSAIGVPEKQRRVLRGFGFRKLQQVVEQPDNPSTRGMIAKVRHLVTIVE